MPLTKTGAGSLTIATANPGYTARSI